MKSVARIGWLAWVAWCGAVSPFALAQASDVVANLSYGPDATQLFDWYKAKSLGSSSATPIVVFQHGGAGILDKSAIQVHPNIDLVEMLVENGIAVMSIDNRPLPTSPYPGPMEDAALAIQHFRANATLYNIDPNRLVLWGHSTGGMIASLVAYGKDYADPFGDATTSQSSRPDALLNWRGLTNWTLMLPTFPGTIFGKSKLSDVDPLILIEASGAEAVLSVPRTFTPPAFSYYNYDESPPPVFNPHDVVMMKSLHNNLQSYPAAAADSVTYQTIHWPFLWLPDIEAQAEWIRERTGLTGPMSLGFGSAGTGGVIPSLSASGNFTPTGAFTMEFHASTPQATPLLLIIGQTADYAPFLGGTLVPQPILFISLFTNASGDLVVNGALPASHPTVASYLQFFQADPNGLFGVAASNALKVVVK